MNLHSSVWVHFLTAFSQCPPIRESMSASFEHWSSNYIMTTFRRRYSWRVPCTDCERTTGCFILLVYSSQRWLYGNRSPTITSQDYSRNYSRKDIICMRRILLCRPLYLYIRLIIYNLYIHIYCHDAPRRMTWCRAIVVETVDETTAVVRWSVRPSNSVLFSFKLCVCWGFCLAGRCRHNKDD